VVGGPGGVVAGGCVVEGAVGRVVRVVGGAGAVVDGTDVEADVDVAPDVVGADGDVVAGSRSIWVPSTRTGWSVGSRNGPTWTASAATSAAHAATTHQNHRPSRTRCTRGTLPKVRLWRRSHAPRPRSSAVGGDA